ncbi:MAG: Omp28-related outer membrane protein [Crocinitomicaceae bacterium]
MRNLALIIAVVSAVMLGTTFTSCDRVEQAFPPAIKLDTLLYTGATGNLWQDYVNNEWPDFDTIANTNPLTNVLVEDFTGHNCSNCPAAADIAHALYEANPTRVFVASIHSSNVGESPFQAVNEGQGYTVDFMNTQGLWLGNYFGQTVQNSGFFGNPGGTVSRTREQTDLFYGSGFWSTKTNEVLAKPLAVALKAHVNYYDATKAFYLHTEVEVLDGSLNTSDLSVTAYLIEDSLVGPQNVQSTYTADYIHRDIMRGTLSGIALGRDLTSGTESNGKYYLDYSYEVPDQLAPVGQPTTYNVSNMHLLIFVHDKVEHVIYQVIKKKIY